METQILKKMEDDKAKITVLSYTEISPGKEIITYITRNEDYYGDVLMKFNFSSSKSLIHFLEKYKSDIINKIPADEADILERLEKQGFLDYLSSKWYDTKYLNVDSINRVNTISPEQIYELSIKYKCITPKQIINYLLEKRDGYLYDIVFKQI